MIDYPVTREYLALLRYMYRHQFGTQGPGVDLEFFEQERRAIALLLAHDEHPSEEEHHALACEYGIMTYFPFIRGESEQK